jgi:CRP/FNR family transcriptional regulator
MDGFRDVPDLSSSSEKSCAGDRAAAFDCSGFATLSREYGKGELLLREGSTARYLFCIRTGIVKLFRTWRDGRRYAIGLAEEGDMIGYSEAITGGRYASSAEAASPVSVHLIPRDQLQDEVASAGPFVQGIVKYFARTLRRSEEECVNLAMRTAHERAARLLLLLSAQAGASEDGGFRPPIKRSDMAELIGTSPETFSRVLADLSRREVIESDRSRILILDRTALLKLAEGKSRD